ncbi:hypothetical protein ACFQO1_11930 [Jejudonia soesokkakensis]|uniref:Uncharacterized protein n=1 Tax=Jejudonia soesokkakensis TaxID=1323432 RepID=A0ABW2MWZ1_9FLAO
MSIPQIAYINFKDNTNYQAIYASQLYGTFFSVFAKLKTRESETENCYFLEEVHLHLNVYKGIVDLGITKAEFMAYRNKKDSDETGIEEGGVIVLEIQAMYNSTPDNLIVKKIDRDHKFNKETSYFMVDRRLKKMHQSGDSTDVSESLKDGIFDTEFNYREGPITIDYPEKIKLPQPRQWHDEPVDFTLKGFIGQCPTSIMKIL